MRTLQDARLEALYERSWADAMAGDEKARDSALKLHDRKVRLHGANAPERAVVAAAISSSWSGSAGLPNVLSELTSFFNGD